MKRNDADTLQDIAEVFGDLAWPRDRLRKGGGIHHDPWYASELWSIMVEKRLISTNVRASKRMLFIINEYEAFFNQTKNDRPALNINAIKHYIGINAINSSEMLGISKTLKYKGSRIIGLEGPKTEIT